MSTNRKKLIPNVVLILVIVVGICWVASRFIHLGRVEYTNNAQVKQHITPINTRVQGFIKKIYFEEYQRVRKGDTLVVIGCRVLPAAGTGGGGLPERAGRDGCDAHDGSCGTE